jgi:hypothetical protein
MTNLRAIAFGFAAVLGSASTAQSAGPSSPYYVTDGDDSGLQVIRSGAIVNAWGTGFTLAPLAVTDTVKVYKHNLSVNGGGDGIEFTLGGTPTGTTYPWQSGPLDQLLDGATDGAAHNYACEFVPSELFSGNNGVWQFDLDWKSPTLLFSVNVSLLGISYDRIDQKLWISRDGGNIQEVTLDGTVVREFYPGVGRWTALAWERSTDTLWANNFGSNTFRQWHKDGTLIDEVMIDGLLPFVTGGEFAVPEPTSVILPVQIFLVMLVRRGRRLWTRRAYSAWNSTPWEINWAISSGVTYFGPPSHLFVRFLTRAR